MKASKLKLNDTFCKKKFEENFPKSCNGPFKKGLKGNIFCWDALDKNALNKKNKTKCCSLLFQDKICICEKNAFINYLGFHLKDTVISECCIPCT